MDSGKLRFKERVLFSLIPDRYRILTTQPVTKSIKHFLAVLLISFIIMFLLFIPSIISLKSDMKSEISKFTLLNVSVDYDLTKSATFLENKIVIEPKDSNRTVMRENEMIFMTKDEIVYNFAPGSDAKKIVKDKYVDLTARKDDVSTFLFGIFMMMLPAVLILGYLFLLIKFGLIILLVTIFAFVISRTIKFEVHFMDVLNIVLHASIFMIFLELVTKPFLNTIYYLNYLLFLIVVIMAIMKNGRIERKYEGAQWGKR